ncbi:MAG TPA: hypothetical protein VF178_04305 [Gemmatimonadaceae bacterium]
MSTNGGGTVHLTISQQAASQGQAAPPAPPSPADLETAIQELVSEAMKAAAAERAGSEAAAEAARRSAQEAADAIREQLGQMRAQGVPVVAQPVPPPFEMIPPQAESMFYAFLVTVAFIAVGIPLVRALGRRFDRRPVPGVAELGPRLDRIEQAVEAVAIEVERISENQRYTTKVIAELRGLPSPPPQGWPAGAQREAEPAARDTPSGR